MKTLLTSTTARRWKRRYWSSEFPALCAGNDNPDMLQQRRRRMARYRIIKAAERTVREAFGRSLDASLAELLDRTAERQTDPPTASAELLQSLAKDMSDEH